MCISCSSFPRYRLTIESLHDEQEIRYQILKMQFK